MKQDEFWAGYENFNNLAKKIYNKNIDNKNNSNMQNRSSIFGNLKYTFKDENKNMFDTFLYFMEEMFKIFTGIYINNSNSDFKGTVFSEKKIWNIEQAFNDTKNSHTTRILHTRHIILNIIIGLISSGSEKYDKMLFDMNSAKGFSDLQNQTLHQIITNAEKIKGKGAAEHIWQISDGLVGDRSLFTVLIDIIKLIQNKNEKSPLVWTSDVVNISTKLTTSLVKIITNWQKVTKHEEKKKK